MVNVRLIAVLAATGALTVGIVVGIITRSYGLSVTLSVVMVAIIAISLIITRRQRMMKLLAICAPITIAVLLASTLITIADFNKDKLASAAENEVITSISCIVSSKPRIEGEYIIAVVQNIKTGGKKHNFSAELMLPAEGESPFYDLMPGHGLKISEAKYSKLILNKETLSESSSYQSYLNNIRYKITAKTENVNADSSAKPDAFSAMRFALIRAVYSAMPESSAQIAVGMLLGEKSLMSQEIRQQFSLSGVAHVLAVSGLHITFIITAINSVLMRMRCRKWVATTIIATLLFVYVGICGFTPSAVRAAVMGVLALCASAMSEYSDSMTNISVACLLILTLRPLTLFTFSFVLSFLSTLGIICLNPAINKGLKSLKIPERIARPAALTISANLALLPVVAAYFKTINLMVVLNNMVLIPVSMLIYFPLALLTPLAAIIPPIAVILRPVGYLLDILNNLVLMTSNNTHSSFILFSFGTIALAYYASLLIASKYIIASSKVKRVMTACALALTVFLTVAVNIPKSIDSGGILAMPSSYSGVCVVSYKEEKVLITDGASLSGIITSCSENKLREIDSVIMTSNIKNEDIFNLKTLQKSLGFNRLYLNGNSVEYDLSNIRLEIKYYFYDDAYKLGENIVFEPIAVGDRYFGAKLLLLSQSASDASVVVLSAHVASEWRNYVSAQLGRPDVLLTSRSSDLAFVANKYILFGQDEVPPSKDVVLCRSKSTTIRIVNE